MSVLTWVGLGLLALPVRSPSALDTCPDVRATQHDARLEPGGGVARCGVGISIFGIRLSLGGATCPQHYFVYPSHQLCEGEPSPGTMCLPGTPQPVLIETCHCEDLTFVGTGLLLPKCRCDTTGQAGEVEDATTVPCLETASSGAAILAR